MICTDLCAPVSDLVGGHVCPGEGSGARRVLDWAGLHAHEGGNAQR